MNPVSKLKARCTILLTFDVEDWFQVENFKACICRDDWASCELRVERNTHALLDLLDSVTLDHPNPTDQTDQIDQIDQTNQTDQIDQTDQTDPTNPTNPTNPINPSNQSSPTATFFILGWIAQRLPGLVREIHARGHEVASHGYEHDLCSAQNGKDLRDDLSRSKRLLEDITGAPVRGYRAPSFSVTDESLKIIRQCGYEYDSSYNSFSLHGRYGRLTLSENGKAGIANEVYRGFYELPISNLKFHVPRSTFKTSDLVLPWGGGAYFRLMPFSFFRRGVARILRHEGAYLFYMHPWELDPEQPRVSRASRLSRLRHYTNLHKTRARLRAMIEHFRDCRFMTCHGYLQDVTGSSTEAA